MQKNIGLVHCVYSWLWIYIFITTLYFACSLRNEQYSGDNISNTPFGITLHFNGSNYFSIIAASIVSTTLGTVTTLELIMKRDSHVLNRQLLSLTLFTPIACLIVYGYSLEAFFPITVINVHALQLACSTACTVDFLRKVCRSTFSDLLSGSYCLLFLAGIALCQIGFGSENFYIFLFGVCTASICTALVLYSVYKFLNDKIALSFLNGK